jgi:hypothetical protein
MSAGRFYPLAGLIGLVVMLVNQWVEAEAAEVLYYYKLPGAGPAPKALLTRLPTRPLQSFSLTTSLGRTTEFDLVTLVVEGRVRSLRRTSSGGADFSASLTIAQVHKGNGVRSGEQMTVYGSTSGTQGQEFMPSVGDEVVAFVKEAQNGRYDLLGKKGFRKRSAAIRRGVPDDP